MATVDADRQLEDPCPSCGAQVRRGLVRCWSCGAFMRQDIAAAYERMQNRRPDVEFQPLPEHTASHPGKTSTSPSATATATDDDFELSGEVAEVGDFEIGSEPTSAPQERRQGASAFTGRRGSETPATPPAAEAAPKAKAAPSPEAPASAPTGDAPDKPSNGEEIPHSIATAGDALLDVALQEEREAERRGRGKRTGFNPVRVSDGWFITCPCPARVRIKVKEVHRGKTGKCPNPSCGSYFTVPADLPLDEGETPATAETAASEATAGLTANAEDKAGPYTHWIRDIRLHVVKPAKAKRKAAAHEKDFQPADLGFSKTAGLAVISLTAKPAGLLAKAKKPEQIREETLKELREGKPLAELSPLTRLPYEPETLGKLIVEFPPAYEHESTFAGIPVFGEGRIVVKLPPAGAPDEQHFVSLTLTQYRRFAELVGGLFAIEQLGLGCPIPKEEDVVRLVCHYSEDPLTVLRNPVFHLADPETPLEPIGYRCESCGLIVSEGSRRKEKIGGLEGKKLASAKCPKCKGKFGSSPLYALKPKEAAHVGEAKPTAESDEATAGESAGA